MKKELNSKKGKDEYIHFYWGKKNVDLLWNDFFAGLSMEQEKDCIKLFVKKYKKIL